jgi:L-ascorbate metabolism protein UlaG (beta-lactamase superfamily)
MCFAFWQGRAEEESAVVQLFFASPKHRDRGVEKVPKDSKQRLDLSRREAMLFAGALTGLALASPARSETAGLAASRKARITQVRNATLRIDYGDVRFLVDPMLGDVGAFPGAPGTAHRELRNPLVPLRGPVDDIVNVDAVIVTHLHMDHWDNAAKSRLPKSLPIFSQNEEDAAKIRQDGFKDVRVLSETSQFKGVKLSKTEGQHGTDATIRVIGDRMGKVSGVVFSRAQYKTIYVAGDTVWNQFVETAISKHRPDVIVLNAGNALFLGLDPIIMGMDDVLAVHRAAPEAMVIASHMEALNHCILSRADLRAFSEKMGFAPSLTIPDDGQTISV